MTRFSFRSLSACTLCAGACLFPAHGSVPTQPVTQPARQPRESQHLVSVRLNRTPIAEALRQAARQSGIRFSYTPDVPLLSDYPWPVNMSMTDQPPDFAARLMLSSVPGKGTARLSARRIASDTVEIFWQPLDETGLPDVSVTESYEDRSFRDILWDLARKYFIVPWWPNISPDGASMDMERKINYSCKDRKLRDVFMDLLRLAAEAAGKPTPAYLIHGNTLEIYYPLSTPNNPSLPNTPVSMVCLREQAVFAVDRLCRMAGVKIGALEVQGYVECSIAEKPFPQALQYLLDQTQRWGKTICIVGKNRVDIYRTPLSGDINFYDTSRIPKTDQSERLK